MRHSGFYHLGHFPQETREGFPQPLRPFPLQEINSAEAN